MKEVVLPDCPPPIFAIGHSMGGTVLMRVARQGSRWFDRIVLSAPMIRLSGKRNALPAKITVRAMRLIGMGSAYVPGGSGNRGRDRVLRQQHRDLRSGAPCPHQGGAGGGARARHRLADRVLAQRRLSHDGRHRQSRPMPSKVRQPLMLIAAGRDQVVSTAAIEDIAVRLRAGSHLIVAGARHELMMEQDRYRAQFWAAFDAFVPGTPLFK